MRHITAKELQQHLAGKKPPLLIDLRENYEYTWTNIGGKNLPLSELQDRLHEIPETGMVVMHCKSGNRSQAAIDFLERIHGYQNLVNLAGGQEAWALEVDPSKTPY